MTTVSWYDKIQLIQVGHNIRIYKVFTTYKRQKWYDNEWGYSNKVVDLIAYMAKVDAK